MAQVVVGGVGDSDLLETCGRVASGAGAQLDTTASSRLQKDAVPEDKRQIEGAGEPGQPQNVSPLTHAQARAVIFAKLLTLVTGSTGAQLHLLSFFCSLLDQGVSPCLPAGETDSITLNQLASSCKGEGQCTSVSQAAQQNLAEVLQQRSIACPGISSAERTSTQRSGAATCGVAALALFANKRLATLATAIAALSCEALQAAVSYKNPVLHEPFLDASNQYLTSIFYLPDHEKASIVDEKQS